MTTTLESRLSSSNESWTDFLQTTVILDRSRVIDNLAVDIFQWTQSNYPRLHLPSPAIMTTTLESRLRSSNESWTEFPQTTFILDIPRMGTDFPKTIFILN
ncbi:unnamed protein product [Cyberlindnera jadinii]|uniref:Uncharacterized protein n=1 Tax=Cyberlindnera jadinii (strain ATCC 18201 / CBS 1600 / BCRC 20928 / JCM 3617 / NBRC 0987 / NRRL Y-1542) TaxID=983966 RepID=A0A0H5C8Z1_CYBJN|nr:unnamed protein product [Cyberlindnera jadinii]